MTWRIVVGINYLPKSAEGAIVPFVSQLLLIARLHETQGFGTDGVRQLADILQIFRDDNVGHEEQHVLLSASERHPQQRVEIVDAGAHYVDDGRKLNGGRSRDGVERDGNGNVFVIVSNGAQVQQIGFVAVNGFSFGFDEEFLDDGVTGRGRFGRQTEINVP